MADSGSATKRHNPVDSIIRKIKTIEMRDQESNPYLQIPKFQSRNFDSPQSSTKKDLEEVLKNRAMKSGSKDPGSFSSPAGAGGGVFSPRIQVQSPMQKPVLDSPLGSILYSTNVTSKEKAKKTWPSCGSQSCSTPVVLPREAHFKFHQSIIPGSEFRSVVLEDRVLPPVSSFYFDQRTENFTLRSPVVKRLSMSEGTGLRRMTEHKAEPVAEVSLICEEDLLDSIFHACDTDHRGKVAVSKIVDYLRHTTSRGSEDSGLSELCNMLDPERRDISMDLDTYHAIMREWVDDCRNTATENKTKESIIAEESMIKLRESLLAVRRFSGTTMNITSGSLEAFGGDVSRDLDTSDLITCVADLQYNNQKLQEEKAKLKGAMEAHEEANQRLLEENEELRGQWKSAQQSISKIRALKGELEELKSNMAALEEARAKSVAQNKQLEKENISLIHKISSLQEENHRSTLEVEDVRKALSEVSDKVAVLQIQLAECESALQKKDAGILLKDLYVEELKSTLLEYNSVIENLRIEKNKMERNLQQMEQELLSNGINSPITYKLNRIINGGLNSLHTELEFAQQSLEVSTAEWMFSSGRTSAFDVTLDREVLLLFQGPGHEQLTTDFKTVLQAMQEDTRVMVDQVLESLQRLVASDVDVKDLSGKMLKVITADMRERKVTWELRLKQLDQHMESLEGEFIKMAGNVRRMKTEQLHLKKELSVRAHELEAARRQLEEAEGRETRICAELRQSAAGQEELAVQVSELRGALDARLAEVEAGRTCDQDGRRPEDEATPPGGKRNNSQLLHKSQSGPLGDTSDLRAGTEESHGVEEEIRCICELIGHRPALQLSRPPRTTAEGPPKFSPLLESLSLETGEKSLRVRNRATPPSVRRANRVPSDTADLQTSSRSWRVSLGVQTDVQDPEGPTMEKDLGDRAPEAAGSSRSELSSAPHGSRLADSTAAPAPSISQDPPPAKDSQSPNPEKGSEGEQKATPPEDVESSVKLNSQIAEEERFLSNDKELETEFLRLSLGFKCDIFTLEKRLRLEERSRDLAEENLKKELSSCKKLLEALTPLCEDDNQTQEIVQKLEKSLQFLSQHTTRVAGRAEMLGAIHQESRVSRAVEVMIQHVENLKRMYAKEHAELEELREVMQQSDRSSCTADREDSLKLSSSLVSKVSPARRVSMPAYTRAIGTASVMDIFGADKLDNKIHRRSNSWKLVGSRQADGRPSLQRFMENYNRAEPGEEPPIREDEIGAESAEEIKEEKIRKFSLSQKTASPTKSQTTLGLGWPCDVRRWMRNVNKPLVVSILAAFLFVTLAGFLTGLSFHRPVEGALVGPGVSWTSIQQLLWPYTGLRHNGPPPV